MAVLHLGRGLARLVARAFCACAAVALVGASAGPVRGSPWVEVGDDILRRDIEVLAAHGLIRGPVTTWPLPWKQVSRALAAAATGNYPPHLRRSMSRLRARLDFETATGRPKLEARAQGTSRTRLVRGFRATARAEVDAEASLEYMWSSTAVRANVGVLSDWNFRDAKVTLDRSYLAQEFGDWLFYLGALDHWWGPGQISSLVLSNNARPVPRIGLMRNDPKPFGTPWLSWLGPWQINASLGLLNDDRAIDDALLFGLRATLNPLPGLEIGLVRSFQICGDGQPCNANAWRKAIAGTNLLDEDVANELAGADIRYALPVGPNMLALYGQYMGEDQKDVIPAKAGFVLGATIAGPAERLGADWQVVFEFSDSAAKLNNDPPDFDIMYEHAVYRTGWRYRGRAKGHSLDNDARLFSVAGMLVDGERRAVRIAYHRAELNRDDSPGGNTVSRTAETVNLVEVGVEIPWRESLFTVEAALQDDRPNTPGEKDWRFSILGGWRVRF